MESTTDDLHVALFSQLTVLRIRKNKTSMILGNKIWEEKKI